MLPREDTTVFLKAFRANGLLLKAACVTPTRACTTGTTTIVTMLFVGDIVGIAVGVAVVGDGVGAPAANVGTRVELTDGNADKGILLGLYR